MRMGLSLDSVCDDGGKVDVDIGDSANMRGRYGESVWFTVAVEMQRSPQILN